MSFLNALTSILYQLGTGVPIWRISAPSSIHEASSGVNKAQDQIFSNGNCLLALEAIDSCIDPIERIGLLITAIFNVNMVLTPYKPFNPVLNEFTELSTSVNGLRFTCQVEQINHHPPIASFRLGGPSFTLEPLLGINGAKGFKPGFNSIEIDFAGSFVTFQGKSGVVIKYTPPGVRMEPLFTGKRGIFNYGKFTIEDSGVLFEGSVSKGFVIAGTLSRDGVTFDTISGNLITGVYLKSRKEVWIIGCPDLPIVPEYSQEVLEDPLFTANVWKKVYEQMALNDFVAADVEKVKVEEAERKKVTEARESRFGFKVVL